MTHITPNDDHYWLILRTGSGQAWSNESGWVDDDSYDLFTTYERDTVRLPGDDAYWQRDDGED